MPRVVWALVQPEQPTIVTITLPVAVAAVVSMVAEVVVLTVFRVLRMAEVVEVAAHHSRLQVEDVPKDRTMLPDTLQLRTLAELEQLLRLIQDHTALVVRFS